MDQTITFNTSLDSEKKKLYQTEPKKLHVSIKKKKVDYRKLLKITPKKNYFMAAS
jgi:hypothetical protein